MTWIHISAISNHDSFLLINMNGPHQHKIISPIPPRPWRGDQGEEI